MVSKLYIALLGELTEAVDRHDGDAAVQVLRHMQLLDPVTTDRLLTALIEIGLRNLLREQHNH